jgi:hypothetical protein
VDFWIPSNYYHRPPMWILYNLQLHPPPMEYWITGNYGGPGLLEGAQSCLRGPGAGLPIHAFLCVFGVFISLINTMPITNSFIKCTKNTLKRL